MKRKILLYPDGKEYSIQELQERLKFRYLIKNAYETSEEEAIIRAKGIQKLESGQVTAESIELGKKYAQEIKRGHIPHVSVRFINEEVGFGLFAEEEILEGAFVGEYTGVVRENNRRYFEPLNNYCYEYPVPDAIGRSYVIDATQGNLTRFMNHSYAPNLTKGYAFVDGFYHAIFMAAHLIAKDSQLLYNYGHNYWYLRTTPSTWPSACH